MGCKSSELCRQHIMLSAHGSPSMFKSLVDRFLEADDTLVDLRDRALLELNAHLADEYRVIGHGAIERSDLSLERLDGIGPFIGSDWTSGLEATTTTIGAW